MKYETDPIDAVHAITSEMFPGEIRVEHETEPDDPTDAFVVFNVHAHGSPKELVTQRLAWHGRIEERFGELGRQFRLSIDPR